MALVTHKNDINNLNNHTHQPNLLFWKAKCNDNGMTNNIEDSNTNEILDIMMPFVQPCEKFSNVLLKLKHFSSKQTLVILFYWKNLPCSRLKLILMQVL